ncbi:G protein-coupled receptor rhodopsin-like [Trinorchestia longiramus]|nr:G protein-coupled receptor rhodopsin-like [Trinorchestia longiramus]
MLVVVVLLFVICWAPILIINLMKAYRIIPPYSIPLKHLATAADLMSYMNSCINPIVYGFMSRHFREGFLNAICCSRLQPKRGHSTSRQLSEASTRMSTLRTQGNRWGLLKCRGSLGIRGQLRDVGSA